MENCPDRKLVEMAKYQLRVGEKNTQNMKECHRETQIGEENWEIEASIKTSYDPSKKASQMPVLRKLEGATPSQRKEFRASEKLRLEAMVNGGMENNAGLRRPRLLSNSIAGRMEGVKSEEQGRVMRGKMGHFETLCLKSMILKL